jgi:hypothetical protein
MRYVGCGACIINKNIFLVQMVVGSWKDAIKIGIERSSVFVDWLRIVSSGTFLLYQ